jgi:hypothetical protein
MEPITTLAATAISILTPYVAKGAEEFAKAAGKEVYEKTKRLYSYVKEKLSGNDEAVATISLYEKNPARHGEALEGILAEEMEKDKKFAEGVSRELEEIGPYIHIILKMEEGEGVIGMEADEFKAGRANVEMDIKKGKNITGGKYKKIG